MNTRIENASPVAWSVAYGHRMGDLNWTRPKRSVRFLARSTTKCWLAGCWLDKLPLPKLHTLPGQLPFDLWAAAKHVDLKPENMPPWASANVSHYSVPGYGVLRRKEKKRKGRENRDSEV